MKNRVMLVVAISIACASAALERAWAVIVPNAKCYNGQCGYISNLCAGEGSNCFYCSGSTIAKFCGVLVDSSCLAGSDFLCSNVVYSGTCQRSGLKHVCTGGTGTTQYCYVHSCADADAPPPP